MGNTWRRVCCYERGSHALILVFATFIARLCFTYQGGALREKVFSIAEDGKDVTERIRHTERKCRDAAGDWSLEATMGQGVSQ